MQRDPVLQHCYNNIAQYIIMVISTLISTAHKQARFI